MPNTLAHFGAQGVLSRTLLPKADIKMVFLGCLLPDVPWIILRFVHMVDPSLDPFPARLYAIAQASLFVTLFLCGAIAAISARPKIIFGILALNALLHLLLDALQTKWANGVHLFAPISWKLLNFELFWPESLTTYALTLLGLLYACSFWKRAIEEPPMLPQISLRKILISIGLLFVYFVLPIIFLNGPLIEDNHFINTKQAKNKRTGKLVEFDRTHFQKGEERDFLDDFGDQKIRVHNSPLDHSGEVSVRARFIDPETVEILDYHEHVWWFRDYSSYVAIILLVSMWGVAWFRSSTSAAKSSYSKSRGNH